MFDEHDGGGGGGRVSVSVFLKMGQSRPLFVIFLVTISIQIEKSVDGVLGI